MGPRPMEPLEGGSLTLEVSEGAEHLPDGVRVELVSPQVDPDRLVALTCLVERELVQVVQPAATTVNKYSDTGSGMQLW